MGTGQCALFAALLGAMLGALIMPVALLVAGGMLMR
jgi:hypothetical protein